MATKKIQGKEDERKDRRVTAVEPGQRVGLMSKLLRLFAYASRLSGSFAVTVTDGDDVAICRIFSSVRGERGFLYPDVPFPDKPLRLPLRIEVEATDGERFATTITADELRSAIR